MSDELDTSLGYGGGLDAEEPLPDPEEPSPDRGAPWFTPRRVFLLIAILLALALVGLLVYLFWFLGKPASLTDLAPRQGIQPIWEAFGPAEGSRPLFSRPMGVAVSEDGRIYVTDAENSRVCVFDSQGRFLFEFGTFGVAKPLPGAPVTYVAGSLNYPVGIDIDSEGNVYVASFHNNAVEVFDADGAPLRRFPDPYEVTGKGGSGYDGLGIAVTDVAVAGDRVYATDAYQVVVFTRDGQLIDQWGRPGTDERGLDHPNGIAVAGDGTVYVADTNNSRVTAFTPDGVVIWQVGTASAGIDDRSERELELPRGLAVMGDGSVLVSDTFGFSLVRISADGEIVSRYGERGVEPGQLNFSNDVAVLRGFVVIADKENNRVQLVRLVN